MRDVVALIPQSTIGRAFVWNIVTSALIEVNPLTAVVNVPMFFVLGKWIEPGWGAKPFVLFMMVISLAGGLVCYVALLVIFMAARVGSLM